MRKRILFVAESITTAQVVRLVSLAGSLDPRRYEVHFASSRFDEIIFGATRFERHPIYSVEPSFVAAALLRGRRIYETEVLRRYLKEDLAVLDEVKPRLVVGDLRLSLTVSAPLRAIPHLALINAYWSPYAVRDGFPLPDHPLVRWLGEAWARPGFSAVRGPVFSYFAKPINDLRRAHGLSPIGSLLDVLTFGDHVLYADTPLLVPTSGAPSSHRYLGPVPWSPAVSLPDFWDALDDTRPCVYATLGSSGDVAALPIIVEALAPLPITLLVATAGRTRLTKVPKHVHVANFLPGDLAARRSSLVISNGGSSTGYQALAEGVPVLGIASNLDQYLAMTAIEKRGAGKLLRASRLTVDAVRREVTGLLASETHRQAARTLQRDFARWSFADRFRALIDRLTSGEQTAEARAPAHGIGKGTSSVSSRFLAAALLIGAAAIGRSARADPTASASIPANNEIRFTVSVDGTKGHVLCALFRKAGWLKEPVQWKKADIGGGAAECVFSSIAPDVYAVSAFHDENDNGRLDTNFLGIPTESWCTSRDAKAYLGPPSFESAKFRYAGSVMRLHGSLK